MKVTDKKIFLKKILRLADALKTQKVKKVQSKKSVREGDIYLLYNEESKRKQNNSQF